MTRMDTDVLFSPTDVTEDAEVLFEFREDVFRLEHCFQDCCQGMSQVFYGVTHDIDIVVDDEETVVCLMWQLYHLYLGILAIVLCHIFLERLVVAGVYGALYSVGSFGEERQRAFIAIVVYQYDSNLC